MAAKVFCTEYVGGDGHTYAGEVIAEDWPSAQRSAPLGHTVIGELVCIIPADVPGETSATERLEQLLDAETKH